MRTPTLFKIMAMFTLICAMAIPFISYNHQLTIIVQSFPPAIYLVLIIGGCIFLSGYIVARYLIVFGIIVSIFSIFIGIHKPKNDELFGENVQTATITTWNTEYWDQGEDSSKFIDTLKGFDADVLLLQEHIYWDYHNNSIKPINKAGILRNCCNYEHVWVAGELVIASRFAGEQINTENENILAVSLDMGNSSLDVINVHVPVHITLHESPLKSAFWRYSEIAIRKRYEALKALGHIVKMVDNPVVGGDFNSTILMHDFREHVLAQFNLNIQDIYPPTFPTSGHSLWRLDYLLSGIETNRECSLHERKNQSDHRAIRCALTWPIEL